MASQGPLIAQLVSQINLAQPGRLAWDTPSNVLADDAVVATCAVSPATYRSTYRLAVSNFGFTIPANTVITGIEFSFECNTNLTLGPQCKDGTAEILFQDSVVGQILSSGVVWTAGIHARTIGAAGNLWGWTPTFDQINDAGFTISFDVQVASGNTASIDYCACKVYYSTVNTEFFEGGSGIGISGTAANGGWRIGFGQGSFGIGLGGEGGRYHASVGTHGLGVGGTADWSRRANQISTLGLGLGGTFWHRPWLAAYGGTHGLGLGGYGEYFGSQYHAGTAYLGLGGTSGWLFAGAGTHGLGLGGTGAIYRRQAFVGTPGGFGLGYGTGNFIRGPGMISSGGIGLSGLGDVSRFSSFPGTSNQKLFRGVGLGGEGYSHGMRDGRSVNPEDDIPRSHRGPVTRRMVFEAILKAIIDGPLNKYTVYISDDEPDMTNVPPGERYAVIIPGSANNDQGDTEGGGPFGTIREDMVEVRVYSHSSIDRNQQSTAWAIKIQTGAMERARQIRKTLHLNDLIDEVGWLLLAQPMRATTTGKATFRRANPQWGYYAERFSITFTEWLG